MSHPRRTEADLIEFLNGVKHETNFVFMFGAEMSGKSTVVSSVVNFLSDAGGAYGQAFSFALEGKANTQESTAYFRWLRRTHYEQRFPSRTVFSTDDEPIYVSMRVVPDKALRSKVLKLTFVDVPGDELADGREPCYGRLAPTINALLKTDGLQLALVLVTSPDTAAADDLLLACFIDYVFGVYPQFDRSMFHLLITKWDTYAGVLKPSEFAAEHMPNTSAKLFGSNEAIVAFSVGDVTAVEGRPHLRRFDPMSAKAFVDWLYVKFTGAPLYRQSWWQRALARFY